MANVGLKALLTGFVVALAAVVGGCSSPSPSEVCAEFGKDAVLAEPNNGIETYRCVPQDTAK